MKADPPAKLDRVAIFLSGLCLVHCLAVPFAVLLGPALGPWLSDSETWVHWLLLAAAAPVSVLALRRRVGQPGGTLNLSLGCGGLLLMFVAVSHVTSVATEAVLTTVGVVMVLIAHLRNMRAHAHAH